MAGRSTALGDVIPPDGLGPVEWNLAWRAAVAFADATGWPNDFAIEIQKRIPVAGGLGGGSADAAAVLRCLNALAPAPLSRDELLAIAAPLGADVPFLTMEAPLALAWGRGERLLALDPLPSRAVTLVVLSVRRVDPRRVRLARRRAKQCRSGCARSFTRRADIVVRYRARSRITISRASSRSVPSDRDHAGHAAIGGSSRRRRDGDRAARRLGRDGVSGGRSSGCARGRPASGAAVPSRMVTTRTATRVVGVEVSD